MMPFTWQIPYQPPDQTALERMKQHFPKPSEAMPIAWFMGEINFLTYLLELPTESIVADDLAYPINQIWIGIKAFPEVFYIDLWKAWFKYLLPYAVALIHTEKDDSGFPALFTSTLDAFMIIYPHEINPEYAEFRDDVVYSLGTRIIPQ